MGKQDKESEPVVGNLSGPHWKRGCCTGHGCLACISGVNKVRTLGLRAQAAYGNWLSKLNHVPILVMAAHQTGLAKSTARSKEMDSTPWRSSSFWFRILIFKA